MKIYRNESAYEAALDRIRYLFDEFPDVVVSFSGGKDSTVTLNLALIVAEEKNRLPLTVQFIDQEAEWEAVIRYARLVMTDPRVRPRWYQMPIKLFNATSPLAPWLYCWQEGETWMRDKEAISIKENVYGTDRFKPLFGAILKKEYPQHRVCNLAGVRCEESPARTAGLTNDATYKWITWGRRLDRKYHQYAFYPLYDWSYADIWIAIQRHGWPYCTIYDAFYQYGVSVPAMRVSNLHHETSVHALFRLQEIEPETWNALTARLAGIATAGQLGVDDFFLKTLPFMFENWRDYRDYLLEHLIPDPAYRQRFARKFEQMEEIYRHVIPMDRLYREHIQTIVTNDYHFTKLGNFRNRPANFCAIRDAERQKRMAKNDVGCA